MKPSYYLVVCWSYRNSNNMFAKLQRNQLICNIFKRAYSEYGRWIQPTDRSRIFGCYANEYDLHRPDYPKEMWDQVFSRATELHHIQESPKISADIATGTGRGALEFSRRGYKSYAVDIDLKMLEKARSSAEALRLFIHTKIGKAEDTGLPNDFCSIVSCLQAFHWFNAEEAISEFYKILIPNGLFIAAWNDRDLSIPWIQEFESLLEKYNLHYRKEMKQAEYVTNFGRVFTRCGRFKLWKESHYDNTSHNVTIERFIDLLRTLSYVRNVLDEKRMLSLEAEVREMLRSYHQDSEFDMKWVCKAYILQSTKEA